jgi:hypothetical protein
VQLKKGEDEGSQGVTPHVRWLGGTRARQVSLLGPTLQASCSIEGWSHQIVHGAENEQKARPGSAEGCNGVKACAHDQFSRFNVG